MNRARTLIAVGLLAIPVAASAHSTIDRNIFLSCVYAGYDPTQCAQAVQDYHHEITPDGTNILRGNKNWYYQNETSPSGETIFRGR